MDSLLSFFKEFDIANLMPEADVYLRQLRLDLALILLIGPILLLLLGAWYYFLPRQEVGDSLGFRGLFRISDQKTWLQAQKLAGLGYGILGAALLVVFGIMSLFFGAMAPDAIANTVLVCVIIELILTLIVWIGIQLLSRNK